MIQLPVAGSLIYMSQREKDDHCKILYFKAFSILLVKSDHQQLHWAKHHILYVIMKNSLLISLHSASIAANLYGKLWKRQLCRSCPASWSTEVIVIDFLVGPRVFSVRLFCLLLPLLFCLYSYVFISIFCSVLNLIILFIFHLLLSVRPPPLITSSHPLSNHPSLPPMWTGCSDLYLSGMDESQVWFKCPNYSPELWCPALGYVAPFLWLLWKLAQHKRTIYRGQIKGTLTWAALPMQQEMESWWLVWKTGHMETLCTALMYAFCTFCLI